MSAQKPIYLSDNLEKFLVTILTAIYIKRKKIPTEGRVPWQSFYKPDLYLPEYLHFKQKILEGSS